MTWDTVATTWDTDPNIWSSFASVYTYVAVVSVVFNTDMKDLDILTWTPEEKQGGGWVAEPGL